MEKMKLIQEMSLNLKNKPFRDLSFESSFQVYN